MTVRKVLGDVAIGAMLVACLWLAMYIVASYTVPHYIMADDYSAALKRVGWLVR